MSKSRGNDVDPVDIANRMGAEIVRLWVASVDFREDVVGSEKLMQRIAETYRDIRNKLFRLCAQQSLLRQPETYFDPHATLSRLKSWRRLISTSCEGLGFIGEVIRWYKEFDVS